MNNYKTAFRPLPKRRSSSRIDRAEVMSVRQPIRVVIRNRPRSGNTPDVIELGSDGRTVGVRQLSHSPTGGAKTDRVSYKCDAVMANASQERVFDEVGLPLCETVLQGYNATALCYGQTSAGKSFTMIGSGHDYHQRGLLPRAIARVFREVSNRLEYCFIVRLQCLEIYNESMYDLLATLPGAERRDLSISESGGSVEVKGLSAPEVATEEEALRLVFEAESNRAVSQHQLNTHSSRSHVTYILSLERRSRVDSSGIVVKSRLTMVDLAGSERLKKAATSDANTSIGSQAAKEQLARESKAINKSLTFLEQVVMALGSRSRAHIPHRSSRLTSVLRDSLGGNCKTVLIANIRTDEASLEETLSTLRFATRMSSVSTSASVNSEVLLSPEAELQKCYAEISELKRELVMHDQLANRSSVIYEPFNEQLRADVRRQVSEYLAADDGHIEVTSLRHTNEIFAQFKVLYHEQEARLEKVLRAGPRSGPEAESDLQLRASIEPNSGVEVVYVGEEVGGAGGFGVGEAPSDARPSQGTIAVARERSEYEGSITAFDTAKSFGGGATEPFASPTSMRGRAYAEFKQGEGKELAEALALNKVALRDKKVEVNRLSREVNTAKHAIDEYRELLERKREQRAGQPASTETDANGQPVDVIDEEEFVYITQLKACKQKYRDAFDMLRGAKSDADYTQQVLETCQAQLLTDFDLWARSEYPEAALHFAAEAEGDGTANGRGGDDLGGTDVLDQDEEFEAMASDQLLKNDPDAVAFMKAAKMASARSPPRGGKTASIRRRV